MLGTCMAGVLQTGVTLFAAVIMLAVVVPFFAANWEESHTHHMRFGALGVTEGQLLIISVYFVTAFKGAFVCRLVWFAVGV